MVLQDSNRIQFMKESAFLKNFLVYDENRQFFELIQMVNEDSYYSIGNVWTKNLEIDHLIPKALNLNLVLGFHAFFYKLLNSRENLFLIHKQCHKKKIINDKVFLKLFSVFFKNELKKHNSTKKTASKTLLQQCSVKAIIVLNDHLLLKNKYQFIFNSNVFKKLVNIAVEFLFSINLINLKVVNKFIIKKKKINNRKNYLKIYKHRMINKKSLLALRSRKINYGLKKNK
jgi:hypothetical protein